MSLISNHNIIAITESKLDDTDTVDVPGYVAFYKNRGKFRRKSGGVLLLIKEELAQYVTVFESKDKKPKIYTRVKKHYCFINGGLCANVLFFKLSKKCVTRDVLFGVMYIPPEGSPFERMCLQNWKILFYILSTTVSVSLGILILGLVLWTALSQIPKISQDMATNNYGFRLLDFCRTVDVAVVNGRAGSDASIGKCTCKNVSVVDYALVSSDLFPLMRDFAVLDFCELCSDVHCPIVLKLNLTEA